MHIRPDHAELDVPTLQAFIRQFPLGLFTTAIPHPDHATLQTTHIPFVIDTPEESHAGAQTPNLGKLRGHMARANPQCKAMISSVSQPTSPNATQGFLSSIIFNSSAPKPQVTLDGPSELAEEVLILFQAPTHSYISPSFYVSTKPASGKVVPTWDYAAVQVYGRARIYHANNSSTGAFLQRQMEDLTDQREPTMGRSWKVGDAPASYVEAKKRGIVGVEVEILRIEGRFKLSQEDSDGDWVGVVQGFKGLGTEEGRKMAKMIAERGVGRDGSLIEDEHDVGTGGVGAVEPVQRCPV